MSTRAVYVFQNQGENEAHVIYKHHDGYPSGAIEFLAAARKNAWPLPRFEADEFGASFIAANKTSPGGVRLVGKGSWQEIAPVDIKYVYLIRDTSNAPTVTAFEVTCDFGRRRDWDVTELFTHPLADIENTPLGDNP